MQGTKQGKAPIGRKAERDEGNGRGAVLLLRIICLSITRRASIIGCAYALFACADMSVVNSLVDNNNNNHRAELSEKIIDCHVNTALYTVAKPSLPLRLIKSFKIRKRKTKNEKKIRPAHVCIAPRHAAWGWHFFGCKIKSQNNSEHISQGYRVRSKLGRNHQLRMEENG
jgi:hypothetical protein